MTRGKDYHTMQKYIGKDGYFVYGSNSNAQPLRYLDVDGVYKGAVVDYVTQISLELGADIRTEPYTWNTAIEKLKSGEIDFCDMHISKERKEDFVFTDPIYNLSSVVAVKSDSIYEYKDINLMKIATERGDYANTFLKHEFPYAELVKVDNLLDAVDLLESGKVDAVVGDEPIVLNIIRKYHDKYRIIDRDLYEEPVAIAMPKSYAELVPIINHAIRTVNDKGQLEKIQQKWFGISTPMKGVRTEMKYVKVALIFILGLMILIGLISLNNYSLKRLVCTRTKELEISRNELQLIFDNIPADILFINEEQKILNANEGILMRAGLKIEDCIGRPSKLILEQITSEYRELFPFNKDDGEKKTRIQVKSGKEIYEIQSYDIVDSSKDEQMYLITMKDITLDEINKINLLQSSKMIAIGQLAAGMAHQIRNPLSVIRMHTYMLSANEHLDTSAEKSLKYIDDSIQVAGKIIDNVLKFWQISNDQMTYVNMKKDFEGMIDLFEDVLLSRSIILKFECDDDLGFNSNIESLKHIFINLLTNSIDATEDGGMIVLHSEKVGNEIIISCTDNGCGIKDEEVENLFNPFFTTKEPGKGTGLGMFIVYTEVEKLKGRIAVESKVGIGTKITLTLPCLIEEGESNEGNI
ncbi:MAG: transporter substrate-binding domain-containing protein [Clostridioides sp.]|nr:transporter substrate-binding domain-containing protein [Clostridioides sp.]